MWSHHIIQKYEIRNMGASSFCLIEGKRRKEGENSFLLEAP